MRIEAAFHVEKRADGGGEGLRMADPFAQQARLTDTASAAAPVIVLPRRAFQRTVGFWFVFATVNGFFGGFAVNELGHLLGWWR